MSKNAVVITGVVDPDPNEPTLPTEKHRGAINEAKEGSLLEQTSKQSLPPEPKARGRRGRASSRRDRQ